MKQRRMATGFCYTSTIQALSAIFIISESCELYMAVHTIEWQISQYLEWPDKTNWDQVYGPFSKGM